MKLLVFEATIRFVSLVHESHWRSRGWNGYPIGRFYPLLKGMALTLNSLAENIFKGIFYNIKWKLEEKESSLQYITELMGLFVN